MTKADQAAWDRLEKWDNSDENANFFHIWSPWITGGKPSDDGSEVWKIHLHQGYVCNGTGLGATFAGSVDAAFKALREAQP